IPDKHVRKEITWGQFDQRANAVANALIEKGIKKGDKVLHLMTNSINWLLAYLGVLRTGAWVVPLNYRFTGKDIKYCADVSEASLLIFGEEFVDRVEDIRLELPLVKNYIFAGKESPDYAEEFESILDRASLKLPEVAIRNEDECGLYFTSGTTGVPKPILLTHNNLESAAITNCVNESKGHKDNFVFLSPLYHTGSIIRWFGNLTVGGRATILIGTSPKYIFETMSEEKGTTLMLMVPWAQDILMALDRGELKVEDYDLSHWRLMTLGAQPVPASLVKRWRQYFPSMDYDTGYGLTEASGTGCIHLGVENYRKAGAIGKPGFNWEARIVDTDDNDVSPGEVGELVVRGNGVMKAYYNNPDETAVALKGGWLHTGDLAKVDDEGFIYLVDRKKDVIITGGENIFPVEVENVLSSHPKIYDVALIGLPDERLGEIAAAIIDAKEGETLTESEIHQFCEKNLPRYKRPRRIIFDRVLRGPTGKIEKPKLRERYGGMEGVFKV
ncbi:MAG: acyl--CoA ligase, partial [Chloroflexi bacterium]|nr:acyl--CoA ligase [Chloroflexota bacterium]